jgi:tRNA wybutosine-synthesizing protein 2
MSQKHKDDFWRKILAEIGKREGKGILTHLAINAGIPLNKNGESEDENILRTPSGLIMLYGDFGPALNPEASPSTDDFGDAFWVSTKQNGITQIWAPRYTMFSRGNVKEKSRLLDFHGAKAAFDSRKRSKAQLGIETAVDLYAGIGYFVFSYAKSGIEKVLGWEINPWSVEGLRRGAEANGWTVRVVRAGEVLEPGQEKIVVMLESNIQAAGRLRGWNGRISHVNCGLLPSSESCWEMALHILQHGGWLHLHENVGVKDIKHRTKEIEGILRQALVNEGDDAVRAEHVELVKTFAPGVWHCVFDIYINSRPMVV